MYRRLFHPSVWINVKALLKSCPNVLIEFRYEINHVKTQSGQSDGYTNILLQRNVLFFHNKQINTQFIGI